MPKFDESQTSITAFRTCVNEKEKKKMKKMKRENESKVGKRKRRDSGERGRHLESEGEMIEMKTPNREAGRLVERKKEDRS